MVLKKLFIGQRFRSLMFLTLASTAFLSVSAQQKHALIIAISDYAPETQWRSINSKNDAPIIEKALVHRGFNKQDIHSYVDNRLTKERIVSLLRKHLIEQVSPRDVVYFHFSGHGQQIATLSDELFPDPDGLDECLVPYDAPSVNYTTEGGIKVPYDYSKHLRDKELRDILKECRAKLGPEGNLFVVIDACHSGGATRGLGLHRGSSRPNVPDDWKPPTATFNRAIAEWSLGKADQTHAPMSVFSGSASNQLNFEYTHVESDTTYGSLSFALAQALMDAPSDITYQGLFDQIKFKMHGIAPRQSPIAEGQLNQVIFGGALKNTPHYFTATPQGNGSRWRVEGGLLQEVHIGSKIHFHKPDTYLEETEQPVEPLAIGTVINAFAGYSVVQIDTGYTLDPNTATWAFLTERAMPNIEVNYAIFSSNPSVEQQIDSLIGVHFKGFQKADLNINQQIDIIIDYNNDETQKLGADRLLVRLTNNAVLLDTTINPAGPVRQYREIYQTLNRYAQARFIKQINTHSRIREIEVGILAFQFKEFKDQGYKASAEDVEQLFENKYNELGDAFLDNVYPHLDTLPLDWYYNQSTRQYEIPEGTIYQFVFTNKKQAHSSYYTCINIDQAYTLKTFFPSSEDRSDIAEDYKIESGVSITGAKRLVLASKPHGADFYKFVFSEKAFDMRRVVNSRGQSRGNQSSFEGLISESFQASSISRSRGKTLGSSNQNRRINNRETSQTLD